MTGPTQEFSASLVRGLAILACFAGGDRLLSILEVAERLGMSRATAHRYMATLQALGFVEQAPAHKYRLTLGVTRLGCSAMSSTSLVAQAYEPMWASAHRTGFAVELGVLDGPEVLVVQRVERCSLYVEQDKRVAGGELRLPLHCTALGKLLLAMVSPRVRQRLLGELMLERRTPLTVPSKRVLREELEDVLLSGLAVCDGELEAAGAAKKGPVGLKAVVGEAILAFTCLARLSLNK